MKLTVFLLVVLFLADVSYGQRRRNRKGKGRGLACHLKDVEKCLDILAAMGKNSNPTAIIATSQGIDKFCGAVKNKFAGCIKDYFKKCGTPLHREVSGLALDQVLSHTNDLCNKGPKREKFLKSSPCLHEKVFSKKAFKEECNNRYLSSLNKASNSRNDSITGVCCGYRFWEECTAKLIKPECGDSGLEAFTFLVSHGFLDLPNVTCPKDLFIVDSKECKSVIAPKTKNLKLNIGDTGIGKYNVANMFSWMFQIQ